PSHSPAADDRHGFDPVPRSLDRLYVTADLAVAPHFLEYLRTSENAERPEIRERSEHRIEVAGLLGDVYQGDPHEVSPKAGGRTVGAHGAGPALFALVRAMDWGPTERWAGAPWCTESW